MKTRVSLAAGVGLVAFAVALRMAAQSAYDTPKQAADALIAAAAKNDTKALVAILGPEGKPLVESGDAVSDKADLAAFVQKTKEKLAIEYDLADPDVAIIFAGTQGMLDDLPVENVREFETFFFGWLERKNAAILTEIRDKKEISDTLRDTLTKALTDAKTEFIAAKGIKAA